MDKSPIYQIMRPPLYDLSEHPKHAQAIGEITAAFNLIEYQLSSMFAFIMRAPPWHSRTAYYAIINANARIDVMKSLIAKLRLSKKEKEKVIALLGEAKLVSKKRNLYVHALWFCPKGTNINPRILTEFNDPIETSQSQPTTVKTLNEVKDQVQSFAIKLSKFVKYFSENHPLTIHSAEFSRTSSKIF